VELWQSAVSPLRVALIGFRGVCSRVVREVNAFLRLLKHKGFKEERMTKVRVYAIGTSTTLESNKSHATLPAITAMLIPGQGEHGHPFG